MIDFGIYEVVQDENGKFIVTEQFSGKQRTFNSIDELVEFIREDLESIEIEK